MPAIRVSVQVTGPLVPEGAERLHRAIERGVHDLVELGEERLAEMLRPRPAGVYLSVTEARPGQYSTGNYRRNVHGTSRNLHGLLTDGGVVYGPWLEGVSSRNATTRFKGYASFRRTAQYMEKEAARVFSRHVAWALER